MARWGSFCIRWGSPGAHWGVTLGPLSPNASLYRESRCSDPLCGDPLHRHSLCRFSISPLDPQAIRRNTYQQTTTNKHLQPETYKHLHQPTNYHLQAMTHPNRYLQTNSYKLKPINQNLQTTLQMITYKPTLTNKTYNQLQMHIDGNTIQYNEIPHRAMPCAYYAISCHTLYLNPTVVRPKVCIHNTNKHPPTNT